MFASLMMASCSMALVENFSSSRSKSTALNPNGELDRVGVHGLSILGLLPPPLPPFCFPFCSGISLTRYILRLPVLRPTSNLSPEMFSLYGFLLKGFLYIYTIDKDSFNLEFVSGFKLNYGPSCKCREHDDDVLALGHFT